MLIKNKTIAIVGGGPGGLTLARLLQLHGATVRVYERDRDRHARVQGTTLDLHTDSGLRALEKAGLMDAFKKSYRPGADKMVIVNDQAKMYYSDHEDKPEEDFGSEHFRPEIDRGPLRDLLLASLEPGTVVWNSHFAAMEKQGDGWKLAFRNGQETYADIVIGADGANSRIRPYITDAKPFYTGIWGILGSVYNPEIRAPEMTRLANGGKVMGFGGGKCFIVSAKGDGSLSFYVSCTLADAALGNIEPGNKTELLAWAGNALAGWHKSWHELIEYAETPVLPIPIYCMPVNHTWAALPNLTMLGDAAHLMPPFAGEGVNMAMLDALELSECLCGDTHSNVHEAITSYELQMRERAARAAQESLENGQRMHSEGALEGMLAFFGGQQVR